MYKTSENETSKKKKKKSLSFKERENAEKRLNGYFFLKKKKVKSKQNEIFKKWQFETHLKIANQLGVMLTLVERSGQAS